MSDSALHFDGSSETDVQRESRTASPRSTHSEIARSEADGGSDLYDCSHDTIELAEEESAANEAAERQKRRLDTRHVFRHTPLHHQDGLTFEQRRKQVLQRRKEHHAGFLRHVRRKWDEIAAAERARLEAARHSEEAKEDDAGDRFRAWAPVMILTVHFLKAFEEDGERIRATMNLRFFLLPLIWRYLKRLRSRLALRKALEREGKALIKPRIPLAPPAPEFLRHASPMLSKWPDEALERLSSRMEARYFFQGSSVFLRGENARTSFVHFIARGLVSVADATEQPPTREELHSMRAFGGYAASPTEPKNENKLDKYVIQAGLFFGEYAAVVGEAFRDSFLAVTDVITYSIESETFLEILASLPSAVQADAHNIAKARFRRRVATQRPSIEDIRASHPFFNGWPNEAVISTLECAVPIVLRKGERAFRDARTSSRIVYVQRGLLGLFTKQKLLRSIPPGQTLGTSAIIPVQPPHFGAEPVATAITYFEGWTIPRADMVSIVNRYRLEDRLRTEYARVVEPAIPRPSPDELRRPKVLHFLPDKSAAALIAGLRAQHVREGTTLARQDAVATDYFFVVWGTLQLVASDSRTRERKVVGELGPGDSFGSAEVIASATCSVSLHAPHSCIVLTATADDVYKALEMGGPNVVISALERANQLVGNRSAVARQKMEAEYHRATVATLKDDPKYRIEEARQAALRRVHAVRVAESEAAAKAESSHVKEQQSVIDRLTTDAKRARELQKLAVEHRVFACIKDQVFGGRRHEHTVLVSEYYSTPMDAHDPVYAVPEQRMDMTALAVGKPELARSSVEARGHGNFAPETGGAFTLDDDGNLLLVDAETARSNGLPGGSTLVSTTARSHRSGASLRPHSSSKQPASGSRSHHSPAAAGSPGVKKPQPSAAGSTALPEASAGNNGALDGSQAFLTETALMRESLSGSGTAVAQPMLGSDAASLPQTAEDKSAAQPIYVSDPLPYLKAPAAPPKAAALELHTRAGNSDRLERRRLLSTVAERTARRREEYQRQLEGMFAVARAGQHPPPIDSKPASVGTRTEVAGDTVPKLPQPSRLVHVDETRDRDASRVSEAQPASARRAPAPPQPPAFEAHTARPPKAPTPDMAVTVDPSKKGRAAGSHARGKVSKGKPHGGILPRLRPVGPLPSTC